MPDEEELLSRYSPMQIQQFRDHLVNIFNDQMEIQTMLGHPVSEETAARRAALPYQLRDVEIARWLAAGADLNPLKEVTNKALVKTVEMLNVSPSTTSNLSRGNTTAGFPTADYGSICSGYSSDSDIVFGYQTALNVAKLVWVALSRACEQVGVAAGFGGNTSLACIVADEVLEAAELILAEYTICDGDTDSARIGANYERLAYINEQINSDHNSIIANDNSNKDTIISTDNANTSTVIANDNANKDTIVKNDNDNRKAIIANDNANTADILASLGETRQLVLRTQIEANLAASLNVVLYMLPAAQGGYLEKVRDIVTADIQKLQAAGQSVGNASHHLSKGNTAYSKGQYKEAYKYYQMAYKAASGSNG
jgi:hypothetical protein